MKSTNNLLWHDGKIISIGVKKKINGYNLKLLVELYESIETRNKFLVLMVFFDVIRFDFSSDFLVMNQNFKFGNIEDGCISLEPNYELNLKLVDGFLKIQSNSISIRIIPKALCD